MALEARSGMRPARYLTFDLILPRSVMDDYIDGAMEPVSVNTRPRHGNWLTTG